MLLSAKLESKMETRRKKKKKKKKNAMCVQTKACR
jgi:hypothetical protein